MAHDLIVECFHSGAAQMAEVDAAHRARCAETVGCELASYAAERGPLAWRQLRRLLSTEATTGAAGIARAVALVAPAPQRASTSELARQLRATSPAADWLDAVGEAVPTGRAARDDRFPGRTAWFVEMDDGLHEHTVCAVEDVDRGILEWAGFEPALELDRHCRPLALEKAVTGLSRAAALPCMYGVSARAFVLGPWVRWRMWSLRGPDLRGPTPLAFVADWPRVPDGDDGRIAAE